ncbi:hypothetical protein ACJZ2D_004061 [Fusarium nematophilum]
MADGKGRDIYVALMGVTGSGKSTFISHCTGQAALAGDADRLPGTRVVQVYSFSYRSGVTIHLVDTPGFDDTNRHDSDILREISSWLSKSYTQKILLSGILYFHRISDPRMQESGKMSIALLLKLCGKNAMKNVVLTTTMWEKVELSVGESRERELETTKEFWGFMKSHGSQVRRHYNNKGSALDILSMFVPDAGPEPQPLALAIQTELADDRRTLDQTSVGKALNGAWSKDKESLQRELEEVREAMKAATEERDETTANMLRQQQDQTNQEVEKVRREQEKLRVTMGELHAQQLAKMQEMLEPQMAATRSLSKELQSKEIPQQTDKSQQEERSGDQKQAGELADEQEEMVAEPTAVQSSTETSSRPAFITVSSPEAAEDSAFAPTIVQELRGHPGRVVSLVFAASGNRLFAGTTGRQIWVWELDSSSGTWRNTDTLFCTRIASLAGLETLAAWPEDLAVKSLVLDPTGTTLIAGTTDKLVRFGYSRSNGRFEHRQRLSHHAAREPVVNVGPVVLSPGGLVACVGEFMPSKLVLFTSAMTRLREYSTDELSPGRGWIERMIRALAFSTDGQHLALGTTGEVIICAVEDEGTGRLDKKQVLGTKHRHTARSLAWSSDGTHLAAGDDSGVIWIWAWSSGHTRLEQADELEWEMDVQYKQVLFSSCGKLLAARAGKETICFWRRDGDRWTRLAKAEKAVSGEPIHSVALHPDGNCIMVGRKDSITWVQIRGGD